MQRNLGGIHDEGTRSEAVADRAVRLYHYCDAYSAEAMMSEEPPYFTPGRDGRFGIGMYASDLEPVDEESIDDVNREGFGGEASSLELSHALVLNNTTGTFKEMEPGHWFWDLEGLTGVPIGGLLVEAMRFESGAFKTIATWSEDDGWSENA